MAALTDVECWYSKAVQKGVFIWCICFQCWGAGMVICLEQGADLHVAQLIPLPLTVSCFSKIQFGFTFLVLAHLASPGKGPLNAFVSVLMEKCRWSRSWVDLLNIRCDWGLVISTLYTRLQWTASRCSSERRVHIFWLNNFCFLKFNFIFWFSQCSSVCDDWKISGTELSMRNDRKIYCALRKYASVYR